MSLILNKVLLKEGIKMLKEVGDKLKEIKEKTEQEKTELDYLNEPLYLQTIETLKDEINILIKESYVKTN